MTQDYLHQLTGRWRTRRKEYIWTLLETVLCVGPAMAALYGSHAALAAQLLYGSAAVFLGFHALAGDPRRYTRFCISISPAVVLLRNHYLFSSLVAIFGFGVLLWWLLSPAELRQMRHNAPLRALLFATFLYWLPPLLYTRPLFL